VLHPHQIHKTIIFFFFSNGVAFSAGRHTHDTANSIGRLHCPPCSFTFHYSQQKIWVLFVLLGLHLSLVLFNFHYHHGIPTMQNLLSSHAKNNIGQAPRKKATNYTISASDIN
jgi:hypothetical protein